MTCKNDPGRIESYKGQNPTDPADSGRISVEIIMQASKNPVQIKFSAVEALANSKGLSIQRYRTRGNSRNGGGLSVTYGLAPIGTRPSNSRKCKFWVSFSADEGSTERCQHYQGLIDIEEYLNNIK